MLQVAHLSQNFGSHWALKNITFSLAKGDFLFLTGPSGAGKTTLMRTLYGSIPVERGAAQVAGFNLKQLTPARLPLLRREVTFVFQDFKIMPRRTVFENVSLALEVRYLPRETIQKRVRAVLRSLQLERKADAKCVDLSGGEQQRVAVARAIVVNPKLLLADEPTGNLDPELSVRMMQVFQHFNAHGVTVIIATHSRELLAAQPKAKILALRDGEAVWANWRGATLSAEAGRTS